jgi:hypothetical protein
MFVGVEERRQNGRDTDEKELFEETDEKDSFEKQNITAEADGFILVKSKRKRTKGHVDGYASSSSGGDVAKSKKIVSWFH